MEKQLGWTTIEQSKRLVEAGLDLDTADMTYRKWKTEWSEECTPYGYYLQPDDDGGKFPLEFVKPCWSLGRLIDLMPRENQNNTFEIAPSDVIENGYAVILHTEKYYMPFNEQTLIDAVVNAVVWLLENNYIKKGETK